MLEYFFTTSTILRKLMEVSTRADLLWLIRLLACKTLKVRGLKRAKETLRPPITVRFSHIDLLSNADSTKVFVSCSDGISYALLKALHKQQ